MVCLAQSQTACGYDGLSDLLGELFRGLAGPKQPAVVRGALLLPPPPENEMKVRKERLEANFAARRFYLSSICELDGAQNKRLEAQFQMEIEESQRKRMAAGNQRQQGFGDFAPVCFGMNGAAACDLKFTKWKAELLEILSPEQQSRLKEIDAQRDARLQQAHRDWVLQLLDTELYFTPEQRTAVSQHLEETATSNRPELYSLSHQNYYLRYQTPHLLLSALPPGILNPEQSDRLKKLRNGNSSGPESERYITFMSNNGVESWYATLDEAIQKQGARLQQITKLQILYYQAVSELDAQALRHLELAAKGTVLYCLHDWKDSTSQSLRQWEERLLKREFGNGNFGFSVSVPDSKTVNRHELWKETLASLSVDSEGMFSAREVQAKQVRMQYLLSLIDQELWLTPTQFEKLSSLLSKKMPKQEITGYEYMYEVVLMAIPLVVLEEAKIKEILDPFQVLAWVALRKQYQFNNNNRNVMIQMQNMGQFSFNIPQ